MELLHKDESVLLKIKTLSEKPGVYRFFDEAGKILYVGKAKNLKRRVSSYFTKNHDSGKLRVMVSKICDLQTTVVDSEWEALLLENSMIKEFKPRFNAMMKDDKTYPWLAVTKEDFPRIILTRKPDRKNQELFGPYASVHAVHLLLETIFEAFKIRTCKVMDSQGRPCLQYQIKRCPGSCGGYISKEEYQENIRQAVEIIKGKGGAVVKQMKEEMMRFADLWEFEKAQEIKEKIEVVEKFRMKSTVVNPEIERLDIFSITMEEEESYLNFMRIVEGAVIQSYTFEIANKMDTVVDDLLLLGMVEIEEKFGALSKEVIVPFIPDIQSENIHFIVPQRGDKKKLLELSQKNVQTYMMEKKKRQELVNPERHSERTLQALQKALNMEQYPNHIECFDNSNTQGSEPVAAMVCFLNGKPAKQEYRHFNIKTVEGPDDFASMEEVVYRRYKRLLDEQKPLPQLVLIDGGKGQLGAACKAISELGLSKVIMLIGIAKRLEDIYKVGDPVPLYLDKKSEAQKLLQRIRDEVHRFGITHHRKRRSKKSLSSELDTIPGIGKRLSEKLLSHFKSVKRIKEAKEEEIAEIIGQVKAKAVKKALGNRQ
ncbi:MAG: excinuclease ABC subunit UvrC [Bacteroidales bacterium]|jgi:excinuclease ABC subunit C|nr:excinuclease ABC subunit UvrC [Bacteroidales bacterium]